MLRHPHQDRFNSYISDHHTNTTTKAEEIRQPPIPPRPARNRASNEHQNLVSELVALVSQSVAVDRGQFSSGGLQKDVNLLTYFPFNLIAIIFAPSVT